MKKSMLTRVAAVTGAAAIAISGATGVAGAQEAPEAPEASGSIPTSNLGSLENTPINQLVNDPEQFFQTSLLVPGSIVLGSLCFASMSNCNVT